MAINILCVILHFLYSEQIEGQMQDNMNKELRSNILQRWKYKQWSCWVISLI